MFSMFRNTRIHLMESQLSLVLQSLSLILHKETHIMATVDELTSAMATLSDTVATEHAEVQDALEAQASKIQELIDQIALDIRPDAVATQEQLDALMASAEAISAAVAGIYTPAE